MSKSEGKVPVGVAILGIVLLILGAMYFNNPRTFIEYADLYVSGLCFCGLIPFLFMGGPSFIIILFK